MRPETLVTDDEIAAQVELDERVAAGAASLAALFKGHPARHLRLTGFDGEGKQCVLARGPLGAAEFLEHLMATPVGARGSIPGFPDGRTKPSNWWTQWVALDLDESRPEDFQAFARGLWDAGVRGYMTRGTSGRGCHLLVFLSEAIPTRLAHMAVKELGIKIASAGFKVDKVFPTSAKAAGAAIFCPYIGAGLKHFLGFGRNPLLDVDLKPVPLSALDDLERTVPEALCKYAETTPLKPRPDGATKPPTRIQPAARLGAPDERFESEASRVRCSGSSHYGVRADVRTWRWVSRPLACSG